MVCLKVRLLVCCLLFVLSACAPISQHRSAVDRPSVTSASETATLLVAFGTTVPEARVSLDAVSRAYEQHTPLFWAYTSDIVRDKLARSGKSVFSVNAALEACAASGIRTVRVQSLHISPAEEYRQLERMLVKYVTKHPGQFDKVLLGAPLLESEQDLHASVQAVLDDLALERKPKEAVLLMAHGNDRGPGDITLLALSQALHQADPLVWLASVEGSNTLDRVLPQLKAAGVSKVWLQPFMLVAGDHARNDLAGADADSWASRLKQAGFTPVPRLKGLGELSGIQALFLKHTDAAVDDLANSRKQD